jgi:acetolactate synthase-1/2/3 large subunit
LDLSEPAIDFVSMARGMGVPARRVAKAEDFSAALKDAFETRGPFLIEAMVPSEYEGLKLKALPHMLNALGSVPTPVAKAIKKKIAP